MNLIRLAIERPIAVFAAVLMVVLFGYVALQTIPIQMIPDVTKPTVQIRTEWPNAAPAEVEREVVNRQEDVLRGLEGLEDIESEARTGRADLTLTFAVGQNMDRAMLLVANRLSRVTGYPSDVRQPALRTANSEDDPIARYAIRRLPGNDRPVHTFRDMVEDIVQDRIERVPGVGNTMVFGGGNRQLHVTIEPELMARYGLTISEISDKLRAANASISAGDIEEGKRRYVVRTEGELSTPEIVENVLLRSMHDPATGRVGRVTVGDIATVEYGYSRPTAMIRRQGEQVLWLNIVREAGANVIVTMDAIRAAAAELNDEMLPRHGLEMVNVYDETIYIDRAISLVRQNILVGGLLAIMVLMLFLRSWRPTSVVALAIPVSVIGAFVAMAALGRSINVISLAGIAFAVGMVVDAAIVVLENIYRLREEGKSVRVAAYEGARQVWGAILVASLTTVLVFVPILTTDLEVGQLFRDIAVAISVAVILSLVVAVTLIPSLATGLLGKRTGPMEAKVRLPVVDPAGRAFVAGIERYTALVIRRKSIALLTVGIITGTAVVATWQFLPKLDYLPDGKRNFLIGRVIPPPGYNLQTATETADQLEAQMRPLWSSVSGPEDVPGEPPKMREFVFIALNDFTFILAQAEDPDRVQELVPILREPVLREPGTFGFFTPASIFGRNVGGTRSIDLNVSGPDLEEIIRVANRAVDRIQEALPTSAGHQLRPIPGLELGAPEIRLIPDRTRLADNQVSARELGLTIDAYNDGVRVAEVTAGSQRIDLVVKGPENRVQQTQGIDFLPVVTGDGTILPASELANIEVTSGPTRIRHKERVRTITLEIRPYDTMPLEEAMDIVREQVVAPLAAEGLPPGLQLRIQGTADELTRTWEHMIVYLLLAVLIVYLVMAILFESFVYPLIILFSVPLATAGALAGLAIINIWAFQPLDMLTLLGFVILIGIVVNNAILLVHQTLYNIRQTGMTPERAIVAATHNRIRPIFMSTLTSVCGMLPLVLFPGAGSELYRGLGTVVIGGLSMSAVLTLVVVPPLMSVVLRPLEARRATRRHEAIAEAQPAE